LARSLSIGQHQIGDEQDCFVIAEIGNNHQGKLETAIEMFQAAKQAGAQAVKLQKRDNRALYTRAMYEQPYDNPNSFGAVYGEHRDALELGAEAWGELAQVARDLKIEFFSTAFDFPSVDFIARFDPPAFKIASGDLTNIPLISYVAQQGKPVILSTGAGLLPDVDRAVEAILRFNSQLVLLQCTAEYPAQFEHLDLNVIGTYRGRYPEAVVGLSSHDNGIAMAVAAYVLGGRVIEKHFTLNRAMKGTDHAFSLEPEGMRKLVRDLRRTRIALGDGEKHLYPEESAALRKMGKSLVAARDLPSGHILRGEDIAIKSPASGLPPFRFDALVGLELKAPMLTDEPFPADLLPDPEQRAIAAV
jgi:N-acetylneuraminate synthase/sialic acid synthase